MLLLAPVHITVVGMHLNTNSIYTTWQHFYGPISCSNYPHPPQITSRLPRRRRRTNVGSYGPITSAGVEKEEVVAVVMCECISFRRYTHGNEIIAQLERLIRVAPGWDPAFGLITPTYTFFQYRSNGFQLDTWQQFQTLRYCSQTRTLHLRICCQNVATWIIL